MLAFAPLAPAMTSSYRICLIGFSAFEHDALTSALKAQGQRQPVAYVPVKSTADCDFVVADADHAESLAEVVRMGLTDRAVYIGSGVPEDAPGWLTRAADTRTLLRELDRLAEQHGGEAIATQSVPEPPVLEHAISAPPAPAAQAKPVGPPKRALVVDDSEIALRYLETRLQRLGLVTERASNSGKAIELLSRQAFDIVLLDVELGVHSDLDGLALCQHIKRHHRHAGALPPAVVMVSAHHAEIDRARGALAGCDAYLGKPIDDDVLLRVLIQQGAVPAPAKSAKK